MVRGAGGEQLWEGDSGAISSSIIDTIITKWRKRLARRIPLTGNNFHEQGEYNKIHTCSKFE